MGNLEAFYENYKNIDSGGVGTVPPGNYNVEIMKQEPKATKAGDGGGYLELKLQIIDGPHAGKFVPPMRPNIWSLSEKAKEIGFELLKAVNEAIGIPPIRDSSDLVGGKMQVTVRPQKNDLTYNETVSPQRISGMAVQNQFNPNGGGGNFNPNGGGGGGGGNFNPNGGGNSGGVPNFMPSQEAPAAQASQEFIPAFRP